MPGKSKGSSSSQVVRELRRLAVAQDAMQRQLQPMQSELRRMATTQDAMQGELRKVATTQDAMQSELRRVAVIQESMQGEIHLLMEGHQGLDRRMGALEQRMDRIEQRLDRVELRLTAVEHGIVELRAEVRTIGERLDAHLHQAHAT